MNAVIEKENQLNVAKYQSVESLIKDLNGEYREGKHLLKQLEEEHLDFQFFVDENLDELVKYLTEAGFSEEQINEMSNRQYGHVLDFYQIQNDSGSYFVMAAGVR